VVYELDRSAASAQAEHHLEGVQDERRAHVAGELPADNHAAMAIDDEGEEG
jgi:hypothetical protein